MLSDTKNMSRVFNNDIVLKIFVYIEISDLFRWQRVSQQFYVCIDWTLKSRTNLMIIRSEYIIKDSHDYSRFFYGQHFSKRTHLSLNNIERAISFESNVYYLSRSRLNLMSISDKCPRIQCLVLKDCFLDEITFDILNNNFNQIKCLSLFQCYLCTKMRNKIVAKMRVLLQNVIRLSVYELFDSQTKAEEHVHHSIGRQFVRMFPNIKHLKVIIDGRSDFQRAVNEVKYPLKCLTIGMANQSMDTMFIPSHYLSNLSNGSCLRSLDIADFFISSDSVEIIIDKLNLKCLGFSCINLTNELLVSLATKHTKLTKLFIYWTRFVEYNYFEIDIKFKNVVHLIVHNSLMSAQHFRQLMQLFPNVKKLQYTPYLFALCAIDDRNIKCRLCFDSIYRNIPKMGSVRKLNITFCDLRLSLIDLMDERLPHLNCISVHNYWTNGETNRKLHIYDLYFEQLVNYLIGKSRQNSRQLFKLRFDNNTRVSNDWNLPKNLLLIRMICWFR